MNTLSILKKELKTMIKDGVKEALSQEFMKLRAALIPFVSDKEQKDIAKRYKAPSRNIAKSIGIDL